MNARQAGVPPFEAPARALLELVATDREHQCSQVLDAARDHADTQRAQARAAACARLRAAFAEQRRLRDEHVAAAQARLATRRRLHEQQRTAALLQEAWRQLPPALLARWQQPATRAQWVAHVLASARERLAGRAWHVLHAPDWPAAERTAAAQGLPAGTSFVADAAIEAGLKVALGGNVIDGTLAGLLAERADIEAALLRQLELAS
jgi:hypothetical protein